MDGRPQITWNRYLLDSLSRTSGKSIKTIKEDVKYLVQSLDIELPKIEVKKMPPKGFRCISVREEAFELLQEIKELERQQSISATVNRVIEYFLENNRAS